MLPFFSWQNSKEQPRRMHITLCCTERCEFDDEENQKWQRIFIREIFLSFAFKLVLWAGEMRAVAFSSQFLVMVCNYNISFGSFESCEMKWKLVCFSSWSGIVKVLLWGTWSDPKLGCWLFKRGVLSQQGCPVQGFKQAEGASWGGGYQNIEIPMCRQGHGHWGSKHT